MSNWIDTKYIGLLSSRLDKFKRVGNDLFMFRCPYCGDSKKNEHKTRGYFYTSNNSTQFKCHNCGESRSLRRFLKENFSDLYKDYSFELFKEDHPEIDNRKKEKAEVSTENDNAFSTKGLKAAFKKLKVRDNILSHEKISEVGYRNPGRKYLSGRCIPDKNFDHLYWIPDAEKAMKMVSGYEERKLYGQPEAIGIPFYNRDGELMYFQFRFLDYSMRYLTLEVAGGTKVWGLDRIDPKKPVWVLEGVFDAMMIDNSVASGGADFLEIKNVLSEIGCDDVRFVWDADFRYNYEVYTRFEKFVNSGEKVVFLDKLGAKDLNEAIKDGIKTLEELTAHLDSRTMQGLRAELELSSFGRPPKQINTNKNGINTEKKRTKIGADLKL